MAMTGFLSLEEYNTLQKITIATTGFLSFTIPYLETTKCCIRNPYSLRADLTIRCEGEPIRNLESILNHTTFTKVVGDGVFLGN